MGKNNINDWETITKNICKLISASDKSKTQIASEIGISKATLSQYLSRRAFPSLITIKALCIALDCTYEDILNKQD